MLNHLRSTCPSHVILVVDDSGSMAGQPSADINETIKNSIDVMPETAKHLKPYFHVSAIVFGTRAQTLIEAQPESSLDESVVANFHGESGSTNAATALEEALRILGDIPDAQCLFAPTVFFYQIVILKILKPYWRLQTKSKP